MPGSAQMFYQTWPDRMNAMKARAGGADIGKAFGPYFQALMKDSSSEGGLSVKHKELIAMAIGVVSRCESCIYAHVEKCIKAGATPREVMDAAGVAVMMGGGPAYTYAPLVSEALAYAEQHAKTGAPN
jgi:AhpD family alkylhydroperoxidase